MAKSKIVITSAIAVGFVGVTYVILKYKIRSRKAEDILKNLDINIVTTKAQCDEVVNEMRRRSTLHQAIGFDCEWVTENGNRQPIALLQLSTFDGFCGLLRLNLLKEVPMSLKELLEDKNIYKVGVAPIDDAKYLIQDYSIYVKSTLDLRHIVELTGHTAGGLAALANTYLGIVLDKNWRIRCSDWAAEELTERQIHYAATDAYVAIKIFVDIINTYNRDFWFFLWSRNSDRHWGKIHGLCSRYADVGYKVKNIKGSHKENKKSKEKTITKKYSHSPRSRPLYHNCFMEAPDGEVLCTCDTKKAKWYLDNKLATLIKDDPLTIRLAFEPAGRSVGEVGRYYTLVKENKCVVCGAMDSYIRKNVVPREYRKYFPGNLVSNIYVK
ncbi:3-5 exonuclease [Danaus plexippus plexippus]|uniref:Exonuclease 3'-5' domain-containing protein 2 n=1 Tax=Danaus plexippus plexippus TaxID=278856 RepID=A0A212EGX6_DANPL|nr:exonuclease 3'-5' domain-containing protein 2-like [Danaus plexippus plexippus]OWR40731.1 3-5 exonuclease [Danaus plexippus plexippus]